MNKDDSKEKEIKQNFNKTLSMYPIKNLEDLYDKEGYRDEEFDKDDKGMWIVHSEMNIQKKGKALESRGMVIYMDRNTRTTHSYFILTKIKDIGKVKTDDSEKK